MKVHRVAPWLALALLVLMGGELVLAYVASLLGAHGLGDMTPRSLVAMTAARDTAQLCLALFGAYAILQAPVASIGLKVPKVGGLALGVAIGLATAFILPWLIHELRLQRSYNLQYEFYIMSHATGLVGAASILVYLLFAPIVEEIVFRGIVLEGLVKVTNSVIAVVVSAVIFAGIHVVGGVAQVTTAFVIGLVFGGLYLRTRSIVPSAVAHVIYNTTAFYPLIPFWLGAKHF